MKVSNLLFVNVLSLGTDLFIIGQKLLFVYHPVQDNEVWEAL